MKLSLTDFLNIPIKSTVPISAVTYMSNPTERGSLSPLGHNITKYVRTCAVIIQFTLE